MNVYLKYILPDRKEVKPAIGDTKIPITIDSPNSVPCTIVVNRYYPIGGQSFNYFCLCSDEFGFIPEMPTGAIDKMIDYTKGISMGATVSFNLYLNKEYKNIYDACIGEASRVAAERSLTRNNLLEEAITTKEEMNSVIEEFIEKFNDINEIPVVSICKSAQTAKDVISAIDNKKKEYQNTIESFCSDMGELWKELQREMLEALETKTKQGDRFVHLMTFSVEN